MDDGLIIRDATPADAAAVAEIYNESIAAGDSTMDEKFGYELVGIQREIGYKNGRWQDVVIMQRVLAGTPPRL